MMDLLWNPAWETGIEKIDAQHRELFRRIDLLVRAIHNDEGNREIPELLSFLLDYVDVHFRDEEAQMEASAYPETDPHRAIHNSLEAKLGELVDQYKVNPSSISDELTDLMADWLINHMNSEDRRLAKHLHHA